MPFSDEPIRPKSSESHSLPSSDPAQLSPSEGVKHGVGTIALNPERYPGVTAGRPGQNGAPLPSARNVAAKSLSELSDAEVMLLAGTGDDSAFGYLFGSFAVPMVSFRNGLTHNQGVGKGWGKKVLLRF